MRFFRFLSFSIFLNLYFVNLNAQYSDTISRKVHAKNIFTLAFYKQPGKDSMVDFIDGVYRVFNIQKARAFNEQANVTHFTMLPSVDYNLATGMAASLKASVLFPTVNGALNNSTIFSELKYTQNNQLISQFVTNFWSKNGQYNFNSNWSYLNFSQKDFGLGSPTTLDLFDKVNFSYLKLYQSFLKRMAPNWYAGPGVNIDYRWNIIDTTTIHVPVDGYRQYGLTQQSNSSGLTFNILYDTRVNNISPVANSAYLNVTFRQNLKLLGSDADWRILTVDYRKYLPFPKYSKNMLAFWSYNQFVLQGMPPYLDLPNTSNDAFNNFGRGYVQGRFRGHQLLFTETEYRFGITENGFIGGVVFANLQNVSAQKGTPIQGLLPGYGAGLRVKFNKHSKTSLALDYAFGQGGSKGIFMNLGEVF